METGGVQLDGAAAGAADDTAQLEAAFAEALGSSVMFMGMNMLNDMKTEMSEMEKELEE
jgi:hypothetical protein